MYQKPVFKKKMLASAIAAAMFQPLWVVTAKAEEAPEETDANEAIEEVMVTATRRSASIQEIPINITAVGSQELQDKRVTELADLAKFVPGLNVVDQGGRAAPPIIVRGLNTDSLGPGTGGADTVATYLGEIPLFVDLNLNDVERVEVLIGPQGTLYGAGTLGGAIRYIPVKPEFDYLSGEVYTELGQNAESDDFDNVVGAIINVPINEQLAVRATFEREEQAGFIDYNNVVKVPGVSNPQPTTAAERSANLNPIKDNNGEEVFSGRIALRWMPTDSIDAVLTHYYQQEAIEGRTLNHTVAYGTGKYESGYRVEEPADFTNQLTSLEITVDLGFAEFVSATGLSKYEFDGQRDQTDLLLDFEYGYEDFPSFTSFTEELTDEETITQEVRLVSQSDGPFNWIVGGFYNKLDSEGSSKEFTPGIPEFWSFSRPDNLEYYERGLEELTEQALFGEVNYRITPELEVTLGGRFYSYENEVAAGFDLPLYETSIGNYSPTETRLTDADLLRNKQDDSGSLFKLNVGYKVSGDMLVYATVSEGYRIGGVNSVPECTQQQINDGNQSLCALPDEVLIKPDQTLNKELGIHSEWMNGAVQVNGAIYDIDWTDIQVAGVTQNGALPITVNGSGAKSQGLEVAAKAILGANFSTTATYAYTDARLTDFAPELVGGEDGESGDRLPGSPKHQGSLGVNYNTDFMGYEVDMNWSTSYTGDILTSVGERNSGETLDDFTTHDFNASLVGDQWRATFFIDNLTNEYAVTSVRLNRGTIRTVSQGTNDFAVRRYGQYMLTPMTAGFRFKYEF